MRPVRLGLGQRQESILLILRVIGGPPDRPVSKCELIFCFKFLYHMVSVMGIFSKELQSETIDIFFVFKSQQGSSSERNYEHCKATWDGVGE